ncbi:MAG: hypothetical protein LUO79_02385, partial [Methanomassiliicoccales archaeon]|nr:hypothetical protein [Methanomassiliicoccales archaeon]
GAKPAKKKGVEVEIEAPDFLAKNSNRSFALRQLWYDDLVNAVEQQIAPEPNKREMMFLTVTNAVLDMVMDVLPEELSKVVSENIDDYIAVTLANKEYGVDILKLFQEEFVKAKGHDFKTEEELDAALGEFQEKFWSTPRKDLKGKTPNDAVGDMLKKYDLA